MMEFIVAVPRAYRYHMDGGSGTGEYAYLNWCDSNLQTRRVRTVASVYLVLFGFESRVHMMIMEIITIADNPYPYRSKELSPLTRARRGEDYDTNKPSEWSQNAPTNVALAGLRFLD